MLRSGNKLFLNPLRLAGRKIGQNGSFSRLLIPRRYLNLQEYCSKDLLKQHGLKIQKFCVVNDPQEAFEAATELDVPELVIKAQILAGGRGKGTFDNGFKGGVHLCNTPEQVRSIAQNMLGYRLVTEQTPSNGVMVNKLMIAESVQILNECYVSIILDGNQSLPVYVVSASGGMNIEQVAKETPNQVIKVSITNLKDGPSKDQLDQMVNVLTRDVERSEDHDQILRDQLIRLYHLYCDLDATQIEINPLAFTSRGWICIDAKMMFDENARFRQSKVWKMRDLFEEDERELVAQDLGLNYIGLIGNIGCMVNGAGLAMATMDLVKQYGAQPANFLDIGGSIHKKGIKGAIDLLLKDDQVDVILINIFGGIIHCDSIANGILDAFQEGARCKKPMVVRLAGTNAKIALDLLQSANLPIHSTSSLEEAVKLAVGLVNTRAD